MEGVPSKHSGSVLVFLSYTLNHESLWTNLLINLFELTFDGNK